MRNALSVNPRSPFLMFLAVRSGKSCKKHPLCISTPARCLDLRAFIGRLRLPSPHTCHISYSC